MISIKNLTKRYGDNLILDNVSFEVPNGTICAFVGENGAGKSTTMRILASLISDYEGEVFIGSKSLPKDVKEIRKIIGFMPDQYGLYDDLSVAEYLEFFALTYGVKKIQKKIKNILQRVQLEDKYNTPIKGLSRGMTQRICLAKALIHDPEVLILDEPASGLDPKLRILLKNLLLDLKEQGKTILVSSHILSELSDYCDSVVFISNGKIVKQTDLINTKNESYLTISTKDNYKTKELLSKFEGISKIENVNKKLFITGKNINTNDILFLLIKNNIDIIFVQKDSRNLEDVYLDVME